MGFLPNQWASSISGFWHSRSEFPCSGAQSRPFFGLLNAINFAKAVREPQDRRQHLYMAPQRSHRRATNHAIQGEQQRGVHKVAFDFDDLGETSDDHQGQQGCKP